ncbi:flagellar biosynthesis protein FlhF [Brassicibacter mesophilus]|uniref:flagellar biosynthesis protein FlhF n=1 Tax=Brassicibacter mesophilus TaxID=745119 RepID=UPI003D21E608
MKIKRFIGSNTQEAMYKLKKELGSDAIILHTRKIKKPGFLGIFKKSLIEVVAALDDENNVDNIDVRRTSTLNENVKKLSHTSSINNQSNKQNDDLGKEIKAIREMMKGIVDSLDTSSIKEFPLELSNILKILQENGVDGEVAKEILIGINEQINFDNKEPKAVREIIRYNLKEYLGESSPITFNGKQKIIFFIGPTGVGKTTTLAKIAANLFLHHKCTVGLITADTYRIAAVEQLKIYAEILNVPLKVIYQIKDIYKSLSNFKDKDIILIDTAGRSHKNKEQMDEIRELIQSVNNKETYLVVNATTDIKTINSILKEYSFINDFKIIFTKADEANNLGIILNTKYYFKNQLSYITTGQNVPDDIEILDIDKLSRTLIGESKDE